MDFEYPIEDIIKPYFETFKGQEGYFVDDTRTWNFFRANTENTKVQDILLKIREVRDDELTELEGEDAMAQHILNLKIDDALESSDKQVVMDIAQITYRGEPRNFYAFASRFCCYHYPAVYPIYNPTIDQVLRVYYKRTRATVLPENLLTDYPSFSNLMEEYKDNFHLPLRHYWELDKFIWAYGQLIIDEFREKNRLTDKDDYLAAIKL
jgi:hypothetical protein